MMTFRRLQRTESSLSFEQNTVKVVGRDGKMMDDQTNVKKKRVQLQKESHFLCIM